MFQFVSFLRGSKTANSKNEATNGIIGNSIPSSLEIDVNVVEDEDGFLEITTRRKTYLEVAKEAFTRQSPPQSLQLQEGTTPVFSIKTEKKTKRSKSATKRAELRRSELNRSPNLEDLDGVNYELKKSNRHTLKLKNKKTPSYYKELKGKKTPSKKMGNTTIADELD